MVRKLVLCISPSHIDKEETQDIFDVLKANKQVYDVVTHHKNKITEYHRNKTWDRFKKLSNEYELIFTSPNTCSNVSKYNPVSRSFFKLWEILNDFHQTIFRQHENHSIRTLFLAEGPGGFAEAFIKYRQEHSRSELSNDEYYGMTLKANSNKTIPDWKIHKECMQKINISFGADNTGNLYNVDNIDYLESKLGAQSIDFITADGGFDFSADFNGQEETSLRLILCEILAALKLQGNNGAFVLKVFDMFQENTLKAIQILSECYETTYIIKPLTSRPANSEKYILCTGFKGRHKAQCHITLLESILTTYDENKTIDALNVVPYNINVLSCLVNFNIYYSLRQVFYIERTIQYIKDLAHTSNQGKIDNILQEHCTKSIKWCEKYNIPHQKPTSY